MDSLYFVASELRFATVTYNRVNVNSGWNGGIRQDVDTTDTYLNGGWNAVGREDVDNTGIWIVANVRIRQGIARTDIRTMARMVGLDRTLLQLMFV